MQHLHIRIHPWVIWWICAGVVCGAIVAVNILLRNLTPRQERVVIILGVLHWGLGGIVCWASEGIQIQIPPRASPERHSPPRTIPEREWHPASDFVLPGSAKRLLPSTRRRGVRR